ncbi:PhoH family protein (plasmid) [Rhizobium bangladeshense]|uniref:PhoH family protein n=1 Tax=Rhizobium bangladeshense TaxID=1138189 RepID=UPI001A990E91|nr:PhoH family protein [Rhizobium bangladeshense]QSY98621.1 PhoH family protein [Rhizobium bangladeshense]
MERKRQKPRRKASQEDHFEAAALDLEARQQPRPKKNIKAFRPATDRQADYADAIDFSTYTFGTGPAGTGKTYVAAIKACQHLRSSDKTKVILTRPAVEAAGEKLGFLPGELPEKFGPYMKPLMRIMIDQLGASFVDTLIKYERLQMIPLAFMRGETFEDALIIADEMQNATREQMKMLLTRIGEGSRMIIDGDPAQTDIGEDSGLEDAIYRLRNIKNVSVVRFEKSDIVRHTIIQEVITAYEREPARAIQV